MPWADVRDLRIYYEQAGSGSRLLYISGTGGDLRRKPGVFDGPLPRHFTVLSFDQRGLGQTSRPARDYTMQDYAEDARGLLDAVGWDRCRVMGVSFGGMVAQELAIRYPDRFERVVLACTSSGGAGGASYPLHLHLDDSMEQRARRQVVLSDVRRTAAWQAANRDEFESLVAQTLATIRVGADEPDRAEGSRRQLFARRDLDTYERLSMVSMPALICGGRYDGIAPAQNLLALQRRVRGSRVELFEGGHAFLVQDPRALESIIEFFNQT
jgi:3-oxoadipate enol-lactonase